MQRLLIKLVLTPLLMLAVSWAARRWGRGIGGLLAGLPVASGPISIYLCAEQGADFAASAAGHSILSLTPVALFSLVYAVGAQRLSMPACLLSGFGVFLLVLYFLQSTRPVFVASMDHWGSRDLDWSDRGPEQATGEISNPLFAMGPTGAHSLRHRHDVPDHSFGFRSWPPMEWFAFADSDYRLATLRLCSCSAGE
ncbi:MAG: hypothetical protein JOZ08_09100 [Verrucomicrobia bacterium]|nr:hypothetical protein [Verrucomicrobiota bacterium]